MNIGFIGYNKEQTENNFKSFIDANEDIILAVDRRGDRIILKDEDIIYCITSAKKGFIKTTVFDYLIISDDSRFEAVNKLQNIPLRFSDKVPEEFRYIYDDIDK